MMPTRLSPPRRQPSPHPVATGDLIDFSPPSSGTSTPVSGFASMSASQNLSSPTSGSFASNNTTINHTHSHGMNGSGNGNGNVNNNNSYGGLFSGFWKRISTATTTTAGSTNGVHDLAPSSSWYSSNSSNPATRTQHSATFPAYHSSSHNFHKYNHQQQQPSPGSTPGAYGDGIAPRIASPVVLPSLEPLTLTGYADDTGDDERILSRGVAEEIRTFLPERLKIGDEWRLVYNLYQHGSSLATLYQRCEEYRGRRTGFVLVVRDGREGTFGAYLTEAPHPAPSYYGTGECFLWRASVHVPLPPPPSADTTDLLGTRSTTVAASTPPPPQSQQQLSSPPLSAHDQPSIPPSSSLLPFPSTQKPQQPQNSAASILSPFSPFSSTGPSSRAPSPTPSFSRAHASQSVRFQNFAFTGRNDYCVLCDRHFLSVGAGSSFANEEESATQQQQKSSSVSLISGLGTPAAEEDPDEFGDWIGPASSGPGGEMGDAAAGLFESAIPSRGASPSKSRSGGAGGVGGGGGAGYGLWLDDAFERGRSATCDTFCNAPLSDQGEKFDVIGVELWVVGAG